MLCDESTDQWNDKLPVNKQVLLQNHIPNIMLCEWENAKYKTNDAG